MPTYSSCSVCHETFLSSTFCLSGIHLKKKIIQTAFNIKELWRLFSEKIYTSPKVYTKILTDKGAENHLRSSVEADRVQKAPSCFLLCCLEQLGQSALHVISLLETLAELTDDRSTKAGCLQCVLYFHVDHMHRLPGLLFSITQIYHYYFIHSLSTDEDDIKGICALLKSFWTRLNYLISPQNVKHPTAAIAYLVFEKILVDLMWIHMWWEIIDHGLGASPGSVTQDPTPKDLTLNSFFLRMLWASMLLFMLLIQTMAMLNGEEGMMVATWDSSCMGGLQGPREFWNQGDEHLGPVLATSIVSKNRDQVYMQSPQWGG